MNIQRFSASMDGLNRRTTALVAGVLSGLVILFGVFGALSVPPLPGWAWGLIALFPLLVLVGCWLYAPRGYEVDERGVRVLRLGRDLTFRWGEIESVEPTRSRVQLLRATRVAGVSGLFGSYGYFTGSEIGGYWMYVTRLEPQVLLRRRDAVPVVLSPDDPDGFIEAVRGYLPEEGDRQKAA